jgi:hypothetical protein
VLRRSLSMQAILYADPWKGLDRTLSCHDVLSGDAGLRHFHSRLAQFSGQGRTCNRDPFPWPATYCTISCRANRRRCCAPFPALCNMLVLGHMVTWLLETPPFHPFRGLQDHWLLACLELRELKASLADH